MIEFQRISGADSNRGELVYHKGKIYRVIQDSTEILIFDPNTGNVSLVELARKIRAEIPAERLLAAVPQLHAAIDKALVKRQTSTSRADKIAVRMSRELIDPKFQTDHQPDQNRFRFKNSVAEVDLSTVIEPDTARAGLIMASLEMMVQLDALRNPREIPPFCKLSALELVKSRPGMRPSRMSILYRLMGPPAGFVWRFQVDDKFDDDEIRALASFDQARAAAKPLSYDAYERETTEFPPRLKENELPTDPD